MRYLYSAFRRLACTVALLALNIMAVSAQQTINLAGEWQMRIDREDVGIKEGWWKEDVRFDDTIQLPGSMPERGKGDDVSVNTKWVCSIYDSSYYFNPFMEPYRRPGKDHKLQFCLTPEKHYVGVTWYKRTINVPPAPQSLSDEYIPAFYTLFLERPHITSQVWVNGVKVDDDDDHISLSVPHKYELFSGWASLLHEGENTIVVRVNNDPETVKVGIDSHSVTDQTQGCWNGIAGAMELRPYDYVDTLHVYPDVDKRQARVHIVLKKLYPKEEGTVTLRCSAFNAVRGHEAVGRERSVNGGVHTLAPVTRQLTMDDRSVTFDVTLDMGEGMLLWDEFSPNLYRLEVEVNTKARSAKSETVFGMRKVEVKDKMFYINGREVQLRGTVENCDFPLTGYAPTDLDSWLKVFGRCKAYGLNHVRFHSYCPPEAAFLAADMVGFYIQPEGPSWPNHGVKLGVGQPIDEYLMDEAVDICNTYGNHPSFTMFCFGNEPAGDWVKWATKHTAMIKQMDPRRVYGGFSVGGGWAWQPGSEYQVKAGARGLAEWSRRAPESTVDFRDKIAVYNGKDAPGTKIEMPYISHETGQWCAFPNFDEISKYTGVNKAKNFDIFRDLLRANGMESRAKGFLMASGKLQSLCYKHEIERTLRTPQYAGYQLLGLNDYSGQGTALVGVTDVFFDDKGYMTAEEFREFSGPIVPLARIPKFTFKNDETFTCSVEINQHTSSIIKGAKAKWEIAELASGEFAAKDLPIGSNIALGEISVPLNSVTKPGKYTLTVTVPGTEARNHWDFWVYPTNIRTFEDSKSRIYITDTLDAKALKVLKKGGRVLICAAGKISYGKEVVQQFTPVFWNTSWFKMRPPHTTGVLIENEHPVFADFPTDYHSDLQWWELVNRAQVMQLTDFPLDFQPLVQSIDTWFVSRKIGMLFEARVGKGRLMMTSMDITRDLDKRIVARQMRESILRYMDSDKFAPQFSIEPQRIADLFTKVAGDVDMYTKDSPDELKPKLSNAR